MLTSAFPKDISVHDDRAVGVRVGGVWAVGVGSVAVEAGV